MRITLDIDPVVLSAARAKAAVERVSLGRALSDIALVAVTPLPGPEQSGSGFPVLVGNPEHRVTDELVADHRDGR